MNERQLPSKKFLIALSILVDALLVLSADLGAFLLRFGLEKGPFPRYNFSAFLKLSIPIIVLRLVCFYVHGLYDKPKYKTVYDTVINVFKATTTSSLIIIVVAFLFRVFAYPRMVIFLSWLITMPLIIFWRLITKRLINWILGKNYFISYTLIIGVCRSARRVATRLIREANIARTLVGFIQVNDETNPYPQDTLVLGTIADLPKVIPENPIDEVVIACPTITKEKIMDIFRQFRGTDVIFKISPGLYEATIGTMASSPAEQVPLISTVFSHAASWQQLLKRLIDCIGSIVGLILFSPLILLISIAIKATSPGEVLFKQKRAGRHGNIFTLYKFRTMRTGSEINGPEFARKNDQRITKVGRILRRFRLDELPQLYNVLINNMSLVGPRPERPYFVKKLLQEIPFYAERLEVKPGITGWAQVTYGYASTLTEHQDKFLYDIYYLENISLSLDLLIIIKTLGAVLRGKGVK